MKKWNGWIRKGLLLSIISALALGLAACGTSSSGDTETTEAQNVVESEESDEAGAEDSVEMTGEDIVGVVGGESESTEEDASEEQTGDEENSDASSDEDGEEETDVASDGENADEPITMIGDSVMLGAKPALEERFANGYVDATESRQVWDADDIVSELEQAGNLASTVVIALGTNGPFNSETGQALIDQLGSDRKVYWVTAYGATLEWQDDTNAAIENVAANNENVHIIDWAAAAEGHSEWFYNDGIHLKEEGQEAYAQVILQGVSQE